jgi:fructokinase
MKKITCFGEVLWDVFPAHKKIGGAPLNVALRLQSLDNEVAIISSIGNDESGKTLLDYIIQNGLDVSCLEVSDKFKTGKVKVILNDKRSASYDIKYPRAWDNIKITQESINLVKKSDGFVFGSLAARDEFSRKTLYGLIEHAKFKIFDLNLRPPYYNKEVLNYLMNRADFMKFNDDELYEVCKEEGSKYLSLEQNIRYISKKTNTNHICVTKGRHGAVLMYDGKFYYNSGYLVKVIDTVGSGDSFLASLISKLLKNKDPQEAIDFACAVGALVATSEGANPKIIKEQINKFINPHS